MMGMRGSTPLWGGIVLVVLVVAASTFVVSPVLFTSAGAFVPIAVGFFAGIGTQKSLTEPIARTPSP